MLLGNYCTYNKLMAIKWMDGGGKNIIVEAIVR